MFEIPRGTRDFTPDEMVKRRYVEKQFHHVFQSYGYQEIQTPTFEHLDLFTEKSGEQILDELYAFTDKGGRKLALRPELTAPVIRFYVNKLQMEPKPLKLYYFGNCFRYDRPQKGRYREFMQAGCELIGTDHPEAIAELISMAHALISTIGLERISLEIGDLYLLKQIFHVFCFDENLQSDLIPLIDKEEFDELESILSSAGIETEMIADFIGLLRSSDLEEITSFLPDDERINESINRLSTVFSYLHDVFGIVTVELNLGIVRGLDYYTGMVFEIKAPTLGAEKQICGGGQYSLISLFGGRKTPTAGFALGFDRTILAMEKQNQKLPADYLDFFVIPVNEELIKDALRLCQELRSKQLKVDIDLKRRGIGKALKYANARRAKKAILLGPDEQKQKAVTIRDLISGEQRLIKVQDLFNEIDQ